MGFNRGAGGCHLFIFKDIVPCVAYRFCEMWEFIDLMIRDNTENSSCQVVLLHPVGGELIGHCTESRAVQALHAEEQHNSEEHDGSSSCDVTL